MLELLTTQWDVEANVALTLISIYGGHVYDVRQALSRLHLFKESFDVYFDADLTADVQNCLEWKFQNKKDNIRMRDTLRQLAMTGFVPISSINDPVAEVISLNNVGGVIKKNGIVVGLNRQVW